MTGDSDKPLNLTELGHHEVLDEKRVAAGVDGDRIEHETLPPGQAQELEERKRKIAAAAFVEAKKKETAAAAATSPAKDPRRNQGSVVAVVVIVSALVLLVAGFAVLMWRLGKSESAIKEHLLKFTDR